MEKKAREVLEHLADEYLHYSEKLLKAPQMRLSHIRDLMELAEAVTEAHSAYHVICDLQGVCPHSHEPVEHRTMRRRDYTEHDAKIGEHGLIKR